MHLDLAVLQASFDAPTLTRGRDYFERRRVLQLEIGAEAIDARVIGTQQQPYSVHVRAVGSNGSTRLLARCSCPMGSNCKHAAAVAFAAIAARSTGRKRDAADGAVESWIESVNAVTAHKRRELLREHVRYVISIEERFFVPSFSLQAFVVPMLRSGGLGNSRRYELQHLAAGSAKHLQPLDRTIGRLVGASGLLGGMNALSPTILGTLLEVLLESERVHWQNLDQQAIQREDVADARIAWRIDDDERQRPHLAGHPGSVLVGAMPLWYVDPDRNVAGRAEGDLAPDLAAVLAGAPAMTAEHAKRVQVALRRVFSATGIDGPQARLDVRVIERDPTPVLHLGRGRMVATAELEFTYGDYRVSPESGETEFRIAEGDGAALWPRQRAFEERAFERLQALDFLPIPRSFEFDSEERRAIFRLGTEESSYAWARFLGYTAPLLRSEGWKVEIDAEFPHEIVEFSDTWDADIEPDPHRTGWFEVDLGIEVDGERIPLLPVIVEALAANGISSTDDLVAIAARSEPIFGRLPSGAYVALPPARVARVLATLVDLFDGEHALVEGERIALPAARAISLAEIDGTVLRRGAVTEKFGTFIDGLKDLAARAPVLPENFRAELRPYQREGVVWMQLLRTHGFGGVLADDMGLGKTVQLLAHVAMEKAAGRLQKPVLIVAPTSVVPNWRAEIARFTPELSVLTLSGPDRARYFGEIPNFDIVLSTYALLVRDAEELHAREWAIAVLDEAQAIKNPRSKAAMSATKLHAEQRIAMTGTPIENNLEELWSIYAFALPGLLGTRSSFARFFRTPIEKRGDTLRRNALGKRLHPFLVRRTKEDVARDLPEKTEIIHRVELGGAQRDLYETIRLAMHKRVRDEVAKRGLARSRIVVLDALLKLRQVCCDPRLLDLDAAHSVKESQKLDALFEMLESLIADGRRILLFSQFTSMLDIIKPELAKRNVEFVEIRGATRDRETPVKRFQNREVPLFLISLKAGGTGLNLTAADTVIHYDPWWNPAVERQATDRAHRIGQEQHVFVYKLIAEGTVEERILELQARKGELAASQFADASSAPLPLDAADIERLFS